MIQPRVSSSLVSRSVFWLILFAICHGLGYPTLNRYDARKTGNVDSAQYYSIVEHSPAAARGHGRYRVLVPYMATPVFHAAHGRIGARERLFSSVLTTTPKVMSHAPCSIAPDPC